MNRETSSAMTLDSSIRLTDDSTSFRCLGGTLSLINGIRLILVVGVIALLIILSLELIYFRRAIFTLMIPASVILLTVIAILRHKHSLMWPIIAISCFHIFVSLYFGLIFLYYYFFKPLYIIMILNWLFDTLYTQKTTSYYIQCAVIFISIVAFGLFNVWQLVVSYTFKEYLLRPNLQLSNNSSTSGKASISLVVNGNDSLSQENFSTKPISLVNSPVAFISLCSLVLSGLVFAVMD